MNTRLSSKEELRRYEAWLARRRAAQKAKRAEKMLITMLVVCATILTVLTVYTIVNENNRYNNWIEHREVRQIVVQRGGGIDDYWAKYAPSWMDRSDYRREIMELNHLNSACLYTGDVIEVYVEAK